MNKNEPTPITTPQTSSSDEQPERELLRLAGHRPAVPAEDLDLIKAAARDEWQARYGTRRRVQTRWALAAAATVIVALGLGYWWISERSRTGGVPVATVQLVTGAPTVGRPGDGKESGTTLVVGETILSGAHLDTTAAGGSSPGRTSLRLLEGPMLRLDEGTRLRLVSSSVIELDRGAVYVDSAPSHGPGRGIEVHTAWGVVHEIGTQFEVRILSAASATSARSATDQDAALRVRVREGSVRVEQGPGSHAAESGVELTLRADGSVSRGTVAPYGPHWDWVVKTAPAMVIGEEGVPIDTFLTWVSRETGWRLELADGVLEEGVETFSVYGPIEGLTPDQALEPVLLGTRGLSHRVVDGTLLVTRLSGEAESD
jgi:ferric-dicitrate binding protein FerR (iron transport regulator)